MDALTTFLDRQETMLPDILTPELNRLYGGALRLQPIPTDRPLIYSNLVVSVDGVISLNDPGQSAGGEISGGDANDRSVLGILEVISDAIIVGAGTLQEEPTYIWAPQFIAPEHASLFAEYRKKRNKPKNPLIIFITNTGRLLPEGKPLPEIFKHPDEYPTLIVTTKDSYPIVEKEFQDISTDVRPHIAIYGVGNETVDFPAMLASLRTAFGIELLLIEAGAGLNGSFLKAKVLDDLFLTHSYPLVGTENRPLINTGVRFSKEEAPRTKIISLKGTDQGDLVYIRRRLIY